MSLLLWFGSCTDDLRQPGAHILCPVARPDQDRRCTYRAHSDPVLTPL